MKLDKVWACNTTPQTRYTNVINHCFSSPVVTKLITNLIQMYFPNRKVFVGVWAVAKCN